MIEFVRFIAVAAGKVTSEVAHIKRLNIPVIPSESRRIPFIYVEDLLPRSLNFAHDDNA